TRWTQACGLAMARRSSLERRLVAVLRPDVNRRRVSAALAGVAVASAIGVAVPVAMFAATPERPGGPQKTGEQQKTGQPQQPAATTMKPKNETAQIVFGRWQASARTDGKIPGALVGQLARDLDSFLERYADDKQAPALKALRLRLDATRDWTQADVVKLLDN